MPRGTVWYRLRCAPGWCGVAWCGVYVVSYDVTPCRMCLLVRYCVPSLLKLLCTMSCGVLVSFLCLMLCMVCWCPFFVSCCGWCVGVLSLSHVVHGVLVSFLCLMLCMVCWCPFFVSCCAWCVVYCVIPSQTMVHMMCALCCFVSSRRTLSMQCLVLCDACDVV